MLSVTMPQTGRRKSIWFGTYDCSKYAIFGSRTGFSSFSRPFGSPEIKHISRAPILFKLGTLILYNILQVGFQGFLEILPSLEILAFLMFFRHFGSPEIKHIFRAPILFKLGTLILYNIVQVGLQGFLGILEPPPPP